MSRGTSLKDIVWKLCNDNGRTVCDNTKEIHYDLMDMLIEKHNINLENLSFENALVLYNYIGEFEMLLNQVGAYYEPSNKKKNKLKEHFEKLFN